MSSGGVLAKGCIVRRGSTYSIVLSLGRDPRTGRRLQRWFGGHRTREAAELHLAELLRLLAAGDLPPARPRLAAYLEGWLADRRPALSPKTAERYAELLEGAVLPHLGGLRLDALRPAHLDSLYRRLAASGNRRTGAGLSPRTVLAVHRLLHRALADGVRRGLLPANPADRLRPPAAPRSRQAALDEEQLALLLRALEGSDLHPPALLAALTGLRRGELLALRWQDVDLAACTLAVRRSLEQTRAGLRFKPPKSRSGLRSLALPGLACEELRRLAAGAGRSGDGPRAAGAEDLVFARPDGRPLEPDAFSATFHDAMLRLGFPGVHLHTLRHSHASQLLRAGASPVEVARRLGHASPVVTLTTYAHLLPGEDAEAARLVEERLRAAMSRLGGSAR